MQIVFAIVFMALIVGAHSYTVSREREEAHTRQLVTIQETYPLSMAYITTQPEFTNGQVLFQAAQMNLFLERLGIKERAVSGELIDRTMGAMERHLEAQLPPRGGAQ